MNDNTARGVPSACRGAARRHRVEGGRRHAVKVKLTGAEYDAIAARAAIAGVSVQRFMMSCALTRKPPAPVPSALTSELAALRRLIANQANNVNQIARKLNSGGAPDGSIPAVADAVCRTMRRLETALGALDAEPAPEQAPDPECSGPGTLRIPAPPGQDAPG